MVKVKLGLKVAGPVIHGVRNWGPTRSGLEHTVHVIVPLNTNVMFDIFTPVSHHTEMVNAVIKITNCNR